MEENELRAYMKDLNEEINGHKETLMKIISSVGWDPELTLTKEMNCWCATDIHHRVPQRSYKEHSRICTGKKVPLLTTQQKLAHYENALKSNSQSSVDLNLHPNMVCCNPKAKKDETTSLLEEMQRQRDLKRRRISHRKRAHTGKKNPTEKMKDIIESMMDSLKEDTDAWD